MNITAQQALTMIRWYDVYSSEFRDYSDNELVDQLYRCFKGNYDLVREDDTIRYHDIFKHHMFLKTIKDIDELGHDAYHEQFSTENYTKFKV
jgi:hypothetical protein